MELSAHEQRVLGCLIEKRRTTPETYPLSLNALRTACNQLTNRDPVMALDDDEVREACTGLHRHGLVRIAAAGQGSRTTKYRHTANEGLPATDEELALLSVLLVRGPQTRGELRTRTERIHFFESLEEVEDTLDDLGRRGLIELMDREPGRKEARYAHQLGDHDPELEAAQEEIAAQHRAQLIGDGALPSSEDDDATGRAPVPTPGLGGDDATSTDHAAAHRPETDDSNSPPSPPASAAASLAPTAPLAPPAPTAPTVPTAPAVDNAPPRPAIDAGPTTAELLARIEALEQRIEELEELVSS